MILSDQIKQNLPTEKAKLKNDQLTKIRIEGYKSIKECTVDFGRINVLIGSNGAGKSNFISAFTFLQNILSRNLQVYTAQSGVNSLFYNGRKVTETIEFRVYFGENSYGFTLIPTDDNRVVFKEEHFEYHGQWDNRSIISKGHAEALWEKGVGNRIDPYVRPILSRQEWRVYHFHDTGRSAKVKQECNISNCKTLQFDAGNLAAFLYRLKEQHTAHYESIVESIQLIAPYFGNFVLEPLENNTEQIVLRWQQNGCDDIFNASQLSDGTLRFICLATLLLQPHKLQPATIIIDEPELGLHPYAITVLAEMVKQISAEKQIIVSTQSVELLNEFDIEDIIVVDKSNIGSEFRRLDSSQLKIWLEEDYALGELWKKNLLGGRLSR